MFETTALLLAGWLLIQEPPKPQDPPQDPPRVDEPKTGATLDPELKTAVEAFNRASGHRFKAQGKGATPFKATAPKEQGAPGQGQVANAKDRAAASGDGDEELKIEGSFERGKPLYLKNDDIEAWCAGDKIVYRTKTHKEWSVVTRPTTNPLGTGDNGEGDTRLLLAIARLHAPNEFLDGLEARVVSCTRIVAEEPKSGGVATFECQLRPEPARKLNDAGARRDDSAVLNSCVLRISVNQGRIEQVILQSAQPLSVPGGPPSRAPAQTPPTNPADILYRYELMDIGKTEVKVPDEVTKLFSR